MDNITWKYDKIPEIYDGKNIADFIDPEIERKLFELEEEEERYIKEDKYSVKTYEVIIIINKIA